MRLKFILVVEEKNPAAVRQIAAIGGFAHSIGVPMTMVPEEDPRSDRVRWGEAAVKPKDQEMAKAALRVLKKGQELPRAELVKGIADLSGKSAKSAGSIVAHWLRQGVLEEVPL